MKRLLLLFILVNALSLYASNPEEIAKEVAVIFEVADHNGQPLPTDGYMKIDNSEISPGRHTEDNKLVFYVRSNQTYTYTIYPLYSEKTYFPATGTLQVKEENMEIKLDYTQALETTITANLPGEYNGRISARTDRWNTDITENIKQGTPAYAFAGDYEFFIDGNGIYPLYQKQTINEQNKTFAINFKDYKKTNINISGLSLFSNKEHFYISGTYFKDETYISFDFEKEDTDNTYTTAIYSPVGEYSYEINPYVAPDEHNNQPSILPMKGNFKIAGDNAEVNLSFDKYYEISIDEQKVPSSMEMEGFRLFSPTKENFVMDGRRSTSLYMPDGNYVLELIYTHKEVSYIKGMEKEFTVAGAGQKISVELEEIEIAEIKVLVKDISGNPLPNASVYLYTDNHSLHQETDANGLIEGKVIKDSYNYRIYSNNYFTKNGNITITKNETITLSFEDYKTMTVNFKNLREEAHKYLTISTADDERMNLSMREDENTMQVYLPYGKYMWEADVSKHLDRYGVISFSESNNNLAIDYSDHYKVSFEVITEGSEDTIDRIIIFSEDSKDEDDGSSIDKDDNYIYLTKGNYEWLYEFWRDEESAYSSRMPFTVNKDMHIKYTHKADEYFPVKLKVSNLPSTERHYVYFTIYQNNKLVMENDIYIPESEKSGEEQIYLKNGTYSFVIDFDEDYNSGVIASIVREVKVNNGTEVNIDLAELLKKYTIQIKEKSSGNNIPDFGGILFDKDNRVVCSFGSRYNPGPDIIMYANPGEYSLLITAPGYRSVNKTLTINNTTAENLLIEMTKDYVCSVIIEVEDTWERSLYGASVTLEGYGTKVIDRNMSAALFIDVKMSNTPIKYTVTHKDYDTVEGTVIVNEENIEDYYNFYISCRVIMSPKTSVLYTEAHRFSVYPLPATDYIYIEGVDFADENWMAMLYNAAGSLVKSTPVNVNGSTVMNVTNLPSGMYILRLSNGKEASVVKVIKK